MAKTSFDSANFARNLKRALGNMQSGAQKGVRLGIALVKTESQKLTPVDEGNLKASAYTAVSVGRKGVTAEVGYTAYYAIWVHEAPMTLKGLNRKGESAKGKYWDVQGTATNKFLEKAFQQNRDRVRLIIAKAASL